MLGLQVFSHSYCRSTLAFYESLSKKLNVPLRICLAKSGLGIRGDVGFTDSEFSHLDIVDVADAERAEIALHERSDWHQIFGVYQTMPHIQSVIRFAIKNGYKFGIASEAPCNMFAPGIRRLVKDFYIKKIAKRSLNDIVNGADFIINWSGDDAVSLQGFGWDSSKIIPCGYFSPPLLSSKFVTRDISYLESVHILCTGGMTWHRGQELLLESLILLKSWGMPVRSTFTGRGSLESKLRNIAQENNLDCSFPGSVSMADLISLYQSCSLFVAPGRQEPWGMRVNDALNCGAPTIVSRGMGASKLIFDYGFGLTFAANDAVDLAWQIRRLISEPTIYQSICNNLANMHHQILPDSAAERVADRLQHNFDGWTPAISSDCA